MERRPSTAMMLAVNTMKPSVVTAKMAGIESTAKSTSVNSITTSTSRRGVAMRTPFLMVKNFCPSYSELTGISRLTRRKPGFFSRSVSPSPFWKSMRAPVKRRNAPKM